MPKPPTPPPPRVNGTRILPKRLRLCVTISLATSVSLNRLSRRYAISRSLLIDKAVRLLTKHHDLL